MTQSSPAQRSKSNDDGAKRSPSFQEKFAQFKRANEAAVENISLEFLYNPHTISLLCVVVGLSIYAVFAREDQDKDANIWAGLKALAFLFLVIGMLTFPNGPFYRPHPIFWRLAFGASVLYLMFLQFIVFQNFKNVKAMLYWLDPKGLGQNKLTEKGYAIDCWDFSFKNIWSVMDIMVPAHFIGWIFTAMLMRHYVICWYISITWEFTEMAFQHLLPNFEECWWDHWILDVLLCNGLGIWVGMTICEKLELREFRWESVKSIPSVAGKLKRTMLQFTPADWMEVRWFDDAGVGFMRFAAVCQLVLFYNIAELNTFFLKNVLVIDSDHPINAYRLILIVLIAAPSIRQYYIYTTDAQYKRLGTQCWVYIAILFSEAIICVKFGRQLFARTQLDYIATWFLFLVIGSIVCVYVCILLARRAASSTKGGVDGKSLSRDESSKRNDANNSPSSAAGYQLRQRQSKSAKT